MVHPVGAGHDVFNIEELASGLCQLSVRRVRVFACYLDDSGHDQRVVTMAGYVASIDAWKEFEAKAEEFLAHYEVPVFHAKEFRSTKGYFEGWTRIKKRSFAIEWYDIAEPLEVLSARWAA